MNIFDRVTATNVVAVYEQDVANRPPFLGEAFFPNKKQMGLELKFLKGKQGVPVALVSANFNTNVLYRDRLGFTEMKAKLPFFKEAYKVDEELRQDIIRSKDAYTEQLLAQVFDDTTDLIVSGDVSVERMRMQLLSQGTILIQENGVDKQYDYGFDNASQYKTATTLWSQASATPFKDFVAAVKAFKKMPTNTAKLAPKLALMNADVFEKLANDPEVLGYFAKLASPIAYPTDAEVTNYLEARTGLKIVVYEKQYKEARDFGGAAKPFYPQDRFTLMGTTDMGETVYGSTPEEIDLLNDSSAATSVAITGTGKAVTTWKEVDPVNVNVKVSEVVAPSCPNIDKIYIVKVL